MSKASELFAHTQRFVREVFAERLREEGFVSYKSEDIHWYRLVNNEVVHAIYFVTRHTALNSFFDIYFGCHPLFIPPVFQKSPYMHAIPGYEQMNDRIPDKIPGSTFLGFKGTMIYGMGNRPYRSPDILIMAPTDKNSGLDILEDILSFIADITTQSACYEMHKNWRQGAIENESNITMSTYFVDEVLYWEDEELYPYCEKYVQQWSSALQKMMQADELKRKDDRAKLERLLKLREVFEHGNRDEYIQSFQDRELQTRKLLKKHANLE